MQIQSILQPKISPLFSGTSAGILQGLPSGWPWSPACPTAQSWPGTSWQYRNLAFLFVTSLRIPHHLTWKVEGIISKKWPIQIAILRIQVWKLSHVAQKSGPSHCIQVALLAAQANEGGKLLGRGPATVGKVVVVVWPQWANANSGLKAGNSWTFGPKTRELWKKTAGLWISLSLSLFFLHYIYIYI